MTSSEVDERVYFSPMANIKCLNILSSVCGS